MKNQTQEAYNLSAENYRNKTGAQKWIIYYLRHRRY